MEEKCMEKYMLFQRGLKNTSAGKSFFSRADTIFSVVDRNCEPLFLKPNGFYLVKVNKEQVGREGQLFYIIEPVYRLTNILIWEEEEVRDRIPLGIWLANFLSDQVQEDKYLYRLIKTILEMKAVEVPSLQEKYEELCLRSSPLKPTEIKELLLLLRPIKTWLLQNEKHAMDAIFALEKLQCTQGVPFEVISTSPTSEELLPGFSHKVKIRYYHYEEREVSLSYAYKGQEEKMVAKKTISEQSLLTSII